jgi:hypothetical protein
MLKGKNIILRPLQNSDLDFLFEIENNTKNWQFGSEKKEYNKQELLDYIANCIEENLIDVKTEGGELSVSFEEINGSYRNIWLSGEASMVYAGEFEC